MNLRKHYLAGCLSIALAAPGGAFAQEQGQSLESAANDPTASITAYQFSDIYTPSYHNSTADGNTLQFRMAYPFRLGDLNNIFRITVPYISDSPSGASGLSDITIFNLATFDRSWGRFGVGAVALLPTGASGLSTEKWGLGPAAGFVAQQPWGSLGLFNQNIFTVAGKSSFPDVNISIIQPILNASLDNGWSIGTSEMTITYDWDRNEFISLPLGVAVKKLHRFDKTPVQFSLSYEHNFYDKSVAPKDTLNFTVKLLVPR
ncbi:hypothetical protein R5H32_18155 [Defluviimonas sp. D31]|uniref:hypothetical protein n=1 Tax=Defluviimonas sp. D31 TaxID=3083253 RepID=UPI00296EA965|nr:hypothetical protein [Defluviimonas sp. D31]MDW4551284.1 hypothetical protein [Defluviimonas sp. D31]